MASRIVADPYCTSRRQLASAASATQRWRRPSISPGRPTFFLFCFHHQRLIARCSSPAVDSIAEPPVRLLPARSHRLRSGSVRLTDNPRCALLEPSLHALLLPLPSTHRRSFLSCRRRPFACVCFDSHRSDAFTAARALSLVSCLRCLGPTR